MNADILQGEWKKLQGKVQKQWGKLTDSDLDKINGQRTELEGLLQQRYGYAKDKAKQEVDEFLSTFDQEQRATTRR